MMQSKARKRKESAVHLFQDGRVAVVAGSGRLPANVVDGLVASGHKPFVVLIAGEAENDVVLLAQEHETLEIEAFASLPSLLRRKGVTRIVLAGGVGRRPRWWRLRPSLPLLSMMARALDALARGDDELLRTVIGFFEGQGFSIVGAHEIVPDLLSPQGVLTRGRPKVADRRNLDAAFVAAKAIGELDIGQAAIAVGGRVVALEGIEGTDGLLQRMSSLRDHGRLGAARRGVLVKCAKPGQELRTDLPSIGPATVEGAHAAGLAGIGVEAGHSLILDYQKTISRADEVGLFVIGLPAGAV